MSIYKKLRDSKGFTLVELLVVIAIIGVLSTLILLQLGAARQKARDAKRVADINQIRSALELYFDDQGRYANDADLTDELVTTGRYMTLLPRDPLTASCTANYTGAGCYGYAWRPTPANPIQFHLWAELERRSTAHAADIDFNSLNTTGGSWGGQAVDASTPVDTNASVGCIDSNVQTTNCVYDIGQTQ